MAHNEAERAAIQKQQEEAAQRREAERIVRENRERLKAFKDSRNPLKNGSTD